MSTLTFLRDVARRPLEMGAIYPSSASLARAMVDAAAIEPGHVVLELGAGSGAFTSEVVTRFPQNPLYLLEPGRTLAAALQARFPPAVVGACLAEDLAGFARSVGMPPVDRVVSGLPWALWSRSRQEGILDQLLPHLAAGARLVTFHYVHSRLSGGVPALREALLARFERVSQSDPVWANLPPAYVHIAAGPRGVHAPARSVPAGHLSVAPS